MAELSKSPCGVWAATPRRRNPAGVQALRATQRSVLAIGLAVSALSQGGAAMAEPTAVYLVRHAEQSKEPAEDPALSPQGAVRAADLARALGRSGVTRIVTSHLRRARETATVVSAGLGVEPQVFYAQQGHLAEHVAETAAAIRQSTGTVLVVGHSNSIPMIASALSGTSVLPFCESSYDIVLVLVPTNSGISTLRFGAPSPHSQSATCQ